MRNFSEGKEVHGRLAWLAPRFNGEVWEQIQWRLRYRLGFSIVEEVAAEEL
jgi:hypothetical protein